MSVIPIREKVIRALRWTAGARFAGQLITWISTIYVIRLLQPHDYGVMSMASLVIAFCALINELGATPALIQKQKIEDQTTRAVYGVMIVVNAILYLLLYLAAPFSGLVFGSAGVGEELTPVIRVLGLQLLISAISAVPLALLQRNLEFKSLALIEFGAMVLGALLTLVLAITGAGVWALVAGNLASVGIRSAGVVAVSRFNLKPVFQLRGLAPIFSFGAKVSMERILWMFYSEADIFMIGRFFGTQALGHYSVAANLANIPVSKLVSILNQVAFPAYARIQENKEQVKRYYLRAIRIAGAFFFPALWGLSAVSREFVESVLSPQWLDAAPIIQVLALSLPLRGTGALLSQVLAGIGMPGRNLVNLARTAAITVACMAIGIPYDSLGVAIGFSIGYSIAALINLRVSLPLFGVQQKEVLIAMWPVIVPALAMYGAVMLVHALFPTTMSPLIQLATMITVGGFVYVSLLHLFMRSFIGEVKGLLYG